MLPLNSLARHLAPLTKSVPPALVSPESFTQMLVVAETLPGEFARSTMGIECRLGDGKQDADLLIQATGDSGRKALAVLPDEGAYNHFIWRRVRSLARASIDPQHVLYGGIDKVWLEFDAAALSSALPASPLPSVFFGFSDCVAPARGRHLRSAVDRHLEITLAALQLLLERPLSTELVADLSTYFHIRSSDLQVFQVGLMLARQKDAIRLCLRSRSPECLLPYVEAVGRTEDRNQIAAWVDRLSGRIAYLCLNLDVGPDASAKIGIECHLREAGAPGGPANWQPLLDELALEGCITGEKRAALRVSDGNIDANRSGDAWPEPLREIASIIGSRSECMCVWALHHIKIVLHEGRAEAKAYFAIDYRWREPRIREESQSILDETGGGERD